MPRQELKCFKCNTIKLRCEFSSEELGNAHKRCEICIRESTLRMVKALGDGRRESATAEDYNVLYAIGDAINAAMSRRGWKVSTKSQESGKFVK